MIALEHPLKAGIEAVRAIILDTDEGVSERIKWNAPSFYFKDDFATFKLRPMQTVQIILHTGAKVKENPKEIQINDPSDLLKWAAKDRCVVTFLDMQDIESKKVSFVEVLRQWIKQM
jgi:Domain of unknown function (DU1801)